MRDPAAGIRFEDARVVRTLRESLQPSHFLRSELARRWVREARLVDFEATDALTVTSPRLPFVTHPFEWCDIQLFDAARLTLHLQQDAVDAGFDLKDASAWNVIFDGRRPVFCDLMSFVLLTQRNWWAMGQFVRHFLMPLLLSRRRGFEVGQAFLVWRDGVPTQVARRLLGAGVFLTRHGPLLLGGTDPGLSARTAPSTGVAGSVEAAARFRGSLHVALGWMLEGVAPLQSQATSSWSAYEGERPHYVGSSLHTKLAKVAEWLARTKPEWVADFGCNTGEFSRMAAANGAHVVALDGDHDSIRALYRTSAPHLRLYPVLAQLDDLSGGRGWAGAEHAGLVDRLHQRFDLVMVLALVHHLSIGAAVPLSAVAAFIRRCTRAWAIVEFIEDDDPQLVELCAQRQRSPGEFNAQRQRSALQAAGFTIESEVSLAPARRSLALLRASTG